MNQIPRALNPTQQTCLKFMAEYVPTGRPFTARLLQGLIPRDPERPFGLYSTLPGVPATDSGLTRRLELLVPLSLSERLEDGTRWTSSWILTPLAYDVATALPRLPARPAGAVAMAQVREALGAIAPTLPELLQRSVTSVADQVVGLSMAEARRRIQALAQSCAYAGELGAEAHLTGVADLLAAGKSTR